MKSSRARHRIVGRPSVAPIFAELLTEKGAQGGTPLQIRKLHYTEQV